MSHRTGKYENIEKNCLISLLGLDNSVIFMLKFTLIVNFRWVGY